MVVPNIVLAENVVELRLTKHEVAMIRLLANSSSLEGPSGLTMYAIHPARMQRLRDVLDRHGFDAGFPVRFGREG